MATWTNTTKNSSNYSNVAKDSASYANVGKNSSIYSNESSNSATYTNTQATDIANLWASSVTPWQLDSPWTYDTGTVDRTYSNVSKN